MRDEHKSLFEHSYVNIIQAVMAQPVRQTRNAGTRAIFGESLRVHSLLQGKFPVLLGRKMYLTGIIGELAAFLQGPTKLSDFEAQGCNYWQKWAKPNGDISIDYGNKWTNFNGVNQLQNVVNSLKNAANSRRHLIVGWDPVSVPTTDLPCCHYAYQWFVNGDRLEMVWTQRSVDVMVGLPSDIVLAALFNILMAQTVGLKPGSIKMDFGDTHIYEPHFKSVDLYVGHALDNASKLLPSYTLNAKATVFNFTPDMFTVTGYPDDLPSIKFELIT